MSYEKANFQASCAADIRIGNRIKLFSWIPWTSQAPLG